MNSVIFIYFFLLNEVKSMVWSISSINMSILTPYNQDFAALKISVKFAAKLILLVTNNSTAVIFVFLLNWLQSSLYFFLLLNGVRFFCLSLKWNSFIFVFFSFKWSSVIFFKCFFFISLDHWSHFFNNRVFQSRSYI